ncbi:hypothetical protein L602_001500000130 [Cupriavidus gilardii J11]|uniref:Uncharacterized protein n=1 Tax=Cupriavidus gilardii J11 TaxID=936133 RepID=A0A562BSV0_9BURK|nr:hypothetical protein [Cupriavidus gilardii]TWG87880.1 hypothetical protein L602_001500000130 [Cupriavidus gilardii J11]
MRFTRFERYTPIDFNVRRQSAFARKQQRERDRYPLFSEHIQSEQHSADEEMARRRRQADRFEAGQRAFRARVWREARARFFSLPEADKDQIRSQWSTWTGPTTALYFSFMVDELSGDQARRVNAGNAARDEIRRKISDTLPCQGVLEAVL